jgi:hypothetical protein
MLCETSIIALLFSAFIALVSQAIMFMFYGYTAVQGVVLIIP